MRKKTTKVPKPKVYMPSEKLVENAILKYLSTIPGMKAWKNQTTGIFDPIRKVYRPLKGRFSGRGSSDILACFQGRFIAIEVKRPKGGIVSLDQQRFIDEIKSSGGIAFVATSIDTVKETLKAEFKF